MTGAELRDLRSRLGLSQDQLAQALGVSRSQVVNWEQGRDRHTGRPAPVPRAIELAVRYLLIQHQPR